MTRFAVAAALVAVLVFVSALAPSGQTGKPILDPARELATKITGPFTLASVGDLITMRPSMPMADAGLKSAIEIIRNADVAFGNFETSISDSRHFTGPLQGFMGPKEVAEDVKAMGFDLLNRANNHLLDSESEGMWETNALLDAAGLVHAGTGRNLDEARAAVYLEMPKGRIALVGLHTDMSGRLTATRRTGNAGGRAGLSGLRLTTFHEVTPEQLEALRGVRNAIHTPPPGMAHALPLPANDPADRLLLLDTWYQAGSRPGWKHYSMSAEDLRDIMRNIRNGKQYADFLIATTHAHQGAWVSQKWAHEDQTPDFLIELAHTAIENGADAFVGHGPHVLRGIEIYRGKPIFYGLGEFFRQSDWRIVGSSGGASELTNAEIAKQDMDRRDVRAPNMYESVIAVSRYDQARLREVGLHPIDTRFDGPLSWVGIPRPAPPETARRILERLQALSKPFGTTIEINGNVGVIRVTVSPTTAGSRQP